MRAHDQHQMRSNATAQTPRDSDSMLYTGAQRGNSMARLHNQHHQPQTVSTTTPKPRAIFPRQQLPFSTSSETIDPVLSLKTTNVGEIFQSGTELLSELTSAFILRNKVFQIIVYNQSHLRVRCRAASCGWSLLALSFGNGQYHIEEVVEPHSFHCDTSPVHWQDLEAMANIDWVTNQAVKLLMRYPYIKPQEVRAQLHNLFGIQLGFELVVSAMRSASHLVREYAIRSCTPVYNLNPSFQKSEAQPSQKTARESMSIDRLVSPIQGHNQLPIQPSETLEAHPPSSPNIPTPNLQLNETIIEPEQEDSARQRNTIEGHQAEDAVIKEESVGLPEPEAPAATAEAEAQALAVVASSTTSTPEDTRLPSAQPINEDEDILADQPEAITSAIAQPQSVIVAEPIISEELLDDIAAEESILLKEEVEEHEDEQVSPHIEQDLFLEEANPPETIDPFAVEIRPKRKRARRSIISEETVSSSANRPKRSRPVTIYKIAGYAIDYLSDYREEDGEKWYTVHWAGGESTEQTRKDLVDNGCRNLLEAFHESMNRRSRRSSIQH